MHWVYLILAIVGEVIGTSALKASEGFSRPVPTAICLTAFGAAFYALSLTLQVMPVGLVYAIWSGLGIVLITIIGYVVFGQVLDLPALLGLGLIIAGVIVIKTLSGSLPD
ncbi:MAG: multidrug efflux SMR transporter [Pseudomonadota bacterium]